MGKNSTVIYHNYIERFEQLSDAQFGQLIKAALEYDRTGQVPSIQDIAVSIAFGFIRLDIDKNRESYAHRSAVNAENGKKGGRKQKANVSEKSESLNDNRHEAKKADMDKDMDMDKENDTDNDGAKAPKCACTREGDIFADRSFSPAMQDKLTEWLRYKAERRETYKPMGLKSFLSEVENKLRLFNESDVIALINECMANNWKGIIWDKIKSRASPQRVGAKPNDFEHPAEDYDKLAVDLFADERTRETGTK